MEYKTELEEELTEELRRLLHLTTPVTISNDGRFAVYNVGDQYTLLKLSPAAQDFLRCGDRDRIRQAPLFQP